MTEKDKIEKIIIQDAQLKITHYNIYPGLSKPAMKNLIKRREELNGK